MKERHLGLLSESDLQFLAAAAGKAGSGSPRLEELRSNHQLIAELLWQPILFESLFRAPDRDPLLVASPFLVFSVLVHRVARDLDQAQFVNEWLGPNRSVPVFDVAALRGFLGAAGNRSFLTELLASYTRVASGSIWQRTARGWRRRRYSELDAMRLAELLELVSDAQRPGIYRRLGDLALFLSGVFPEYAAAHPLEPRKVERIRRLLAAETPDELLLSDGQQKGIWLLEWLGRRAYRLAEAAGGWSGEELAGVADGFRSARRVLNLLTGRYLYPTRDRWFPQATP